MIQNTGQLHANLFQTASLPHASTRDGFGEAIVEVGKEHSDVVVLSADVSASVRADTFKRTFPKRYVEVGVAEQNMMGIAAGLANTGKVPFVAAYAAFSPGRNWEQVRTTVALSQLPVKIMGMHTGVSVGPDGATHQMLEDITLMRVLPHMTVIVPVDKEEAKKAVRAAAYTAAPTYIRFTRHETPVFTTPNTPFEIGKAEYLWRSEQPRVAIIGAGPLLYDALIAARILEEEGVGVSVLNVHSIKPMDIPRVLEAARDAGAVVTVEEHQILGGVGGTVAEILAQNTPLPMEMVAIHDVFGQSGTPEELLAHYGLTADGIAHAARRARARADGTL